MSSPVLRLIDTSTPARCKEVSPRLQRHVQRQRVQALSASSCLPGNNQRSATADRTVNECSAAGGRQRRMTQASPVLLTPAPQARWWW